MTSSENLQNLTKKERKNEEIAKEKERQKGERAKKLKEKQKMRLECETRIIEIESRKGRACELLLFVIGGRWLKWHCFNTLGACVVEKFFAGMQGLFNKHEQYVPVYACSMVV